MYPPFSSVRISVSLIINAGHTYTGIIWWLLALFVPDTMNSGVEKRRSWSELNRETLMEMTQLLSDTLLR